MQNFTKLTVVVLSLLLLLGCATKVGKPPGVASGHAGERVTINVLAFPDQITQVQINAFNDQHPDVQALLIPLNNGSFDEIKQQVAAQIATGDADVALGFGAEQLAVDHQLVDLRPFLAKTGLDTKPFGTLLDNLAVDGHVYEFPWRVTPLVLAYNPEIFQAAGVATPGQAWTWTQFRETAARLTKGEGESKIWGFDMTTNPGPALPVVEGNPTDKRLHDALQLLTTMIFTDKSMPSAPKLGELSEANRFMQMHAAMTIDRVDSLLHMFRIDPKDKKSKIRIPWELAPIPTWPGEVGQPVPHVGTESMVISAASKHQDAAWQFLSFFAGPDGGVVGAKFGQLNAYRTPAIKSAWFAQQPVPPASTELLFTPEWAGNNAPVRRRTVDSAATLAPLYAKYNAATLAALSGERNWEDALAEALQVQAQINAINQK